MHTLVRQAARHVAVRGLDPDRVTALAAELLPVVLTEPAGFRAGALARAIARACSSQLEQSDAVPIIGVATRKSRWNLSDLVDPARLAEWLNYDGNPPVVYVQPERNRRHSPYYRPTGEEKPVADPATAAQWWAEYRDQLAQDFAKINPYKPRTHTQFLAECLSSMGIKGGTVQERIAKAKAAYPELYGDEATA